MFSDWLIINIVAGQQTRCHLPWITYLNIKQLCHSTVGTGSIWYETTCRGKLNRTFHNTHHMHNPLTSAFATSTSRVIYHPTAKWIAH